MNFRNILFITFFICLIGQIQADSGAPDSLLTILKNEKRTIEERIGKARNSKFFAQLTESETEFLRFCSIAENWYQESPNNDKLFLISYIKCECYREKNKIGEFFVEADKFKQKTSNSNSRIDNIRSLLIYDRIYSKLDMHEEWVKNARQLYHLRKNNENHLNRVDALSSYCWTLNNCGFYLKDTILLDSCLYYYDLLFKTIKECEIPWNVTIEVYSTYMLVLKRVNNYEKTLSLAKDAIAFSKTKIPEEAPMKFALANFYRALSQAKFVLGETDSAFYYAKVSDTFDVTKRLNIIEGPISYLIKLKKYDLAAKELYPYIFGERRKIVSEYIGYFCGYSAPVFEKAMKYKEAAYCYKIYKTYSDSVRKIENQETYEYNKIKYKLIIESERKSAQLAAEKMEMENQKEKEKKNLILLLGSIFAVVISIFLIIVYGRYKLTQKQKTIIESQKHVLITKNEIIEEKHKEITDSINYAERIQKSFLATKDHLDSYLKEYFILFKPKDIVSGDFYWSSTLINGNFIFVTADSTGHGVPGAIMSLLNITSLEKAIETETEPNAILNATRKTIIERLKKDGSIEGGKDGMDCSVCVYDLKNMKLIVSAAHNPVWIVRTSTGTTPNAVIEIKPDKMPVGKHDRDSESFTQKEIRLLKGDVIYTFTDGFSDQFGGPLGKKFMSKNLRELLSKNAHLPMPDQKIQLEKTFKDWIGNIEQIDDVTVIGVRI